VPGNHRGCRTVSSWTFFSIRWMCEFDQDGTSLDTRHSVAHWTWRKASRNSANALCKTLIVNLHSAIHSNRSGKSSCFVGQAPLVHALSTVIREDRVQANPVGLAKIMLHGYANFLTLGTLKVRNVVAGSAVDFIY